MGWICDKRNVRLLPDVPNKKMIHLLFDCSGVEYLGPGDWHTFNPKAGSKEPKIWYEQHGWSFLCQPCHFNRTPCDRNSLGCDCCKAKNILCTWVPCTDSNCRYGAKCNKMHPSFRKFIQDVAEPAYQEAFPGDKEVLNEEFLDKNMFLWSKYGISFAEVEAKTDSERTPMPDKDRRGERPLEFAAFDPEGFKNYQKKIENQQKKAENKEKTENQTKDENKTASGELRPENIPERFKDMSMQDFKKKHGAEWREAMAAQYRNDFRSIEDKKLEANNKFGRLSETESGEEPSRTRFIETYTPTHSETNPDKPNGVKLRVRDAKVYNIHS